MKGQRRIGDLSRIRYLNTIRAHQLPETKVYFGGKEDIDLDDVATDVVPLAKKYIAKIRTIDINI
jgi:hypothetical protein